MSILERYTAIQQDLTRMQTLIVVTKNHAADAILPLLIHGHRHFGENRVQETQDKWPTLRADYPNIELHLIGALQTNKVKDALSLFNVIQTVDREKLAQYLAKHYTKEARTKEFYIQVNTGEEPQKAGIAPLDTIEFVRYCQQDLGLPITGLMAIPPVDAPPSPHFAWLKQMADRLKLPNVSMGMSDDWRLALDLGATHIRVGSAIMGARSSLP